MNHFERKIYENVVGRVKIEAKSPINCEYFNMMIYSELYSIKHIPGLCLYGEKQRWQFIIL